MLSNNKLSLLLTELTGRSLILVAVIIVIAVLIIYLPGLQSGFLFDDRINITDNPKLLMTEFTWEQLGRAAFSSNAGPLKRPLSMLSFGLNHLTTGLDPFYFKLTNLIIHLLVGASLFLLTYLLLTAYQLGQKKSFSTAEKSWLSLAVSAAWLLHPFNLTSVLYVVQRMTSLATLFMVWGLILYLWGRIRQLQGRSGAIYLVAGPVGFGMLAALSKENGLLLFLLIFITEWTILRFQAPTRAGHRLVVCFNGLTAVLPALLITGFLLFHLGWLTEGYTSRDFTLPERLLTQARVVWFYIQMILLPDTTRMGLYHDDIQLSQALLQPPITLLAVLGMIGLLAGALAMRKAAPLVAFGLLFFSVGHILESTVLPLEIAHEHRNYLPSYGLLLMVFYYLGHRWLRERYSSRLQVALLTLFISLLGISTAVRASYWANDIDLALVEVQHHPASARSNMQAGEIHFNLAERGIAADANWAKARHYFEIARRLEDYNLSGSFALLVLDDREQRPLNQDLLEDLALKLETKPLSSASINALLTLGQCQNKGPCKLPVEVLNRLFRAILQNPSLQGKSRAQVLTDLAQLAINLNDLEMALYITQQALTLNPAEPQVHLNHAHLLIKLGHFAAARQAIERSRELDTYHFLAAAIQHQEQLLEQAVSAIQ